MDAKPPMPTRSFWGLLSDEGLRIRFWWPGVTLLAVFSYLYGLGGLHIPHIGDEAPYIQIARLTAQAGRWLPLQTAEGLENTKPPLLFWLGIVSTDWARDWSLLRLRLPVMLHTFVTAGLVFLLASRITGNREKGYLSGLTFLGFWSTFHYGRPFLTNLPETLFVFSALFPILYFRTTRKQQSFAFWLLLGIPLGIACLYKSFALVAPVGVGLAWIGLSERQWNLTPFLRKDAPKIAAALLLALACFTLWPALDPDPASVLQQFVLRENFGKLEGEGYIRGLFRGAYPVWRIWLGHLVNGGAFALPLVYIAALSVRNRKRLLPEEKSLWIFVLSFLIVYSLPSQRQSNYLIPTTPALAILLGVRWAEIQHRWFHLFNIPLLILLAILVSLLLGISNQVLPPQSYQLWQLTLPWLGLGLAVLTFFLPRTGPLLFHSLVFLIFVSFACLLAPLEGPWGRFPPQTVDALKGRTVFVPSHFISRHERHRFLLPNACIRPYDPSNLDQLSHLLKSRRWVAVQRPLHADIAGPFRVFGRRLDVKTRQPAAQVWRILFKHDFSLLLQQEILIRLRDKRPD